MTVSASRSDCDGRTVTVRLVRWDEVATVSDGADVAWAEIGITTVPCTPELEDYRIALRDASGVDLILIRWTADYDDPDNFTHGVFHSRDGIMRDYYSSPGIFVPASGRPTCFSLWATIFL